MRSLALSLLMVVGTAAGCATAINTPAQDLAWERWRACDHFTAVTLDRIDLDGRIIVNGYQNNAEPFTACVHTAAANQTRSAAAAMPQALVLVKNYGCQGGAM